MKPKRLEPAAREAEILAAALKLAATRGYAKISREQIAEAAGCSTGLVSRYFGTMTNLRRTLMRKAIERRIVKVVAQGLADGNPLARKAPDDLRSEAVQHLAKA